MKATKFVTGLVTFLFLMTYCTTDDESFQLRNNGTLESTPLHLTAEKVDTPFNLDRGMNLSVSGLTSCNLSQSVVFRITGFVDKEDEVGEFVIRTGMFDLKAVNSDCHLVGNLSGRGYNYGERTKIDADITVSYGTGSFIAESGKLKLQMETKMLTENPSQMKYTISLDGDLLNREFKSDVSQKYLSLATNSKGNAIQLQDGMTVSFGGQSPCNLADVVDYALEAFVSRPNEVGEFTIPTGMFEIKANGGGCYLIGDVEGSGYNYGESVILQAKISVSHGKGTFLAEGGKLEFNLSGQQLPDDPSKMDYTVSVDGYLENGL